MDRGYGPYPDTPRSPARIHEPGRTSTGMLVPRDYYDAPSHYGNPRSGGDRMAPPGRMAMRRAADDYDVAPRRLFVEPDARPRGSSMVPMERRPLHIVPPPADDRLRPAIHTAPGNRRPHDSRDQYYVVPAATTRTGHGRHLSVDADDRARYYHAPSTARPSRPPQYIDDGRYYAAEPARRQDERSERRLADAAPPPHHRHLLAEHALRPRAASDLGTRERPVIGPEYVRRRPTEGPVAAVARAPDRTDRNDRGSHVRHEYRYPKDEHTNVNTAAAGAGHRAEPDRRRFSQQPITLHQDYDYGYSSAEEGRRERDAHRPRTYHDSHDRRYDARYDSDSDRRRRHDNVVRDPSTRRDRPSERDGVTDDRNSDRRQVRYEAEDRRPNRDDDGARGGHTKSRREDERDDEDKRRKYRDDRRDDDKDRRSDDRNKHIAEALGLGGAGAGLLSLAKNAIKKHVGSEFGFDLGSDDDNRKDKSHSDRPHDYRRRKRDETAEERRERHRRRREQETEEEREARHRRQRERRERRNGDAKETNGDRHRDRDADRDRDRDRDRDKDRDRDRDNRDSRGSRDRDRDDDRQKGSDGGRDRLLAGTAGAALGASAGALVPHRDKSRNREKDEERDRSRARDSRDDSSRGRDRSRERRSRDESRPRSQHRRRGDETDTTETTSSDSEVEAPPMPMRSRANSAARPPPAKGILKTPTERFPDRTDSIREGVAPLKEGKELEGIPPNARWTKVSRKLINPDALREAQERFDERVDHVVILRVLTHEEIQKLAARTQQLREKRHREHMEMPAEERERREQEEMDRERERERADGAPLAISDRPHNEEQEAENAVRFAVDSRNGGDKKSASPSPVPAHPAYGGPPPEQQRRPENVAMNGAPSPEPATQNMEAK